MVGVGASTLNEKHRKSLQGENTALSLHQKSATKQQKSKLKQIFDFMTHIK